jgi:hypothetical protein
MNVQEVFGYLVLKTAHAGVICDRDVLKGTRMRGSVNYLHVGSGLQRFLILLVTVMALMLLVVVIARYMIDVPHWDQWDFVPTLEKCHTEGLTLSDLASQHNEHRLFFPRLIMVGLAILSGWNTNWQLPVNVICVAGVVALMALQTWRAQGRPSFGPGWYLPAMALVAFSINGTENWISPFQLQIGLCVFGVVGAFVLLGERASRLAFTGAVVAAIVATYSFASGALVWPLGLVMIGLVGDGIRSRSDWARAALWAGVGAVMIGLYAHGFERPAYHPPPCLPHTHPKLWTRFVLTYIGGPFSAHRGAPIGGFGLLLGMALVWLIARRRMLRRPEVASLIAVGLYGLAVGLIITVGRGHFGLGSAALNRYYMFANLIWLMEIALLAVAATGPLESLRRRSDWLKVAAFVVMMLISGLAVRSNRVHLWEYRERNELLLQAGALMQNPETEMRGLRMVYPAPERMLHSLHYLRSEQLSLFRPCAPCYPAPPLPAKPPEDAPQSEGS